MKHSAGLLLYRDNDDQTEVFLVHPGGPLWARKDLAAWSIPKGEFAEGEDPLEAAKREFREETGLAVPAGNPVPLRPVQQSGQKVVHAWYLQGQVDAAAVRSNNFEMEWPPGSGTPQAFPEIDQAAWFSLGEARIKLHKGQAPLIDELERALGLQPDPLPSPP